MLIRRNPRSSLICPNTGSTDFFRHAYLAFPHFVFSLRRIRSIGGRSFGIRPCGAGDLKDDFGPEDVFRYLYAVLQSRKYRTRYHSMLRREFPRVVLTSSLTAVGGALIFTVSGVMHRAHTEEGQVAMAARDGARAALLPAEKALETACALLKAPKRAPQGP